MLNLTGKLRAPLFNYEVTLSRKPTLNAAENIRMRVEHVSAMDEKSAKAKALALPKNKAFKVSSVRKI